MAEALDDLRALLNYSRAISFTGESRDVIDYAAKLLGPCKSNHECYQFIAVVFVFVFPP